MIPTQPVKASLEVSTSSLKMHWNNCKRVLVRVHAVKLHWYHHRHHHKLHRRVWFCYFCKSVSKSAIHKWRNPMLDISFPGSLHLNICATGPLSGHPDQIMDHKSQILAAVSSIKWSNHRELCYEPNIFSSFAGCEIHPERRVDLDLNWPWRWGGGGGV